MFTERVCTDEGEWDEKARPYPSLERLQLVHLCPCSFWTSWDAADSPQLSEP